MKILHVNTHDTGGAAIACLRLHKELLNHRVDSKVLVLSKKNNPEKVYLYKPIPPSLLQRAFNKFGRILKQEAINDYRNYLLNRPTGFEIFTFPHSNFDITQHQLYKEADIINLHWVSDFIDYTSFFRKNKKKIIWTLHDMNPFTGGCHHSDDCVKYTDNCNNCPQLQGTMDPDFSNQILKLKMQALGAYPERGMAIVTPSNWLGNLSKRGKVFSRFSHYNIPNGCDSSVFKIYDKNSSKKLLNLPVDKKIILFVAGALGNSRKGLSYLEKANERLIKEGHSFTLVSVGEFNGKSNEMSNVIQLGRIADEELMAKIYSAADVFVIPSLAENLPNTIIESFFCGTPVIGFPVGGIKEMIQNAENGYLCDTVSVDSLVEKLNIFLMNSLMFNSEKIRTNAVKIYSSDIQASRYIELYKTLLKAN
jgi:glycosyltransferase involved in cell wall biosynthesis